MTRPTTPRRARSTRARWRRELEDEGDAGDAEEAVEAVPRAAAPERRGPDYKADTTRSDEIVDADELCESDEWQRLRENLDK